MSGTTVIDLAAFIEQLRLNSFLVGLPSASALAAYRRRPGR
jgi:hypothetical protein